MPLAYQVLDPGDPGGSGLLAAGWVLATNTGSTTFTYKSPGSSNPGTFTGNGTTTWNWPMRYAFRCRIVNQCVIVGNNLAANCSIASVDLDYGGDAAASQQSNVMMGFIGPQGWIMPRSKNRAGWKFIECGGFVNPFDRVYGSGSAGLPATVASPTGFMNFADLPGQTGVVQPGPFEGQEYDIIDSSNQASPANFGLAVSGGFSFHVKVRCDNAGAWRITG